MQSNIFVEIRDLDINPQFEPHHQQSEYQCNLHNHDHVKNADVRVDDNKERCDKD